jgi:hypothetical protein
MEITPISIDRKSGVKNIPSMKPEQLFKNVNDTNRDRAEARRAS